MKIFRCFAGLLIPFLFCNWVLAADLSEKEVIEWAMYYYKDPRPEMLEDIVKSKKLCGTDNAVIVPMGVFLSVLFEKRPEDAEKIIRIVKDYSESEKKCYKVALLFADIPGREQLFKELVGSDGCQDEQIEQIKKPVERIEEIPINSPTVLDMLWGAFMASGDEKYVKRVISTLSFKTDGDVGELVIGNMAKLSLDMNMRQHEKVLDICVKEAKMAPPEVKSRLQKIIEDAGSVHKKDS